MSRIVPRQERYKIFENEQHIGFFNVVYSIEGRKFSADLFAHSQAFILMPDKQGHISHDKLQSWLIDRMVPPTRIGINDLLRQMGLSEYDQLSILKYTSARHTSDTCRIDFTQ
jgi:hypothetical protein